MLERESPSSPEVETEEVSKVILEFMRHGKKEKDPAKSDEEIRLTPAARHDATEKGRQLGSHADMAVTYGSPRKRAQESAARVMLGNEGAVTDAMTLEQIEEMIARQIKFGKKIVVDNRLDFKDDGGGLLDKAYIEGKLMDFMVNDSDAVAVDNEDAKMTSYSRAAGNVAEIVLRNLKIAEKFNKVVESDPGKYGDFNNELERYFGTHSSIGESFLLKAVEKVRGAEERDKIMKELGGMFKELQGFRIEIGNHVGGEQTINLYAKVGNHNIDLELSVEILNEIVREREEFDKQFK